MTNQRAHDFVEVLLQKRAAKRLAALATVAADVQGLPLQRRPSPDVQFAELRAPQPEVQFAELLAALAAAAAGEPRSQWPATLAAVGAAERLAWFTAGLLAAAELLAAVAAACMPYESDVYAADVTRWYVPLPSLLPRPFFGMMGTGK